MTRIVKVGNPQGRIALYLDETEAVDLAEKYGRGDGARRELLEAVMEAYPDPLNDDEGPEEGDPNAW